jgi:hypothetical protein
LFFVVEWGNITDFVGLFIVKGGLPGYQINAWYFIIHQSNGGDRFFSKFKYEKSSRNNLLILIKKATAKLFIMK